MVKIHLTLNHLKRWCIEHFIFYVDHFGLFDYVLLLGSADVSSSHCKPIWKITPCQSLLPKAEVLWDGETDPSPPVSFYGIKGPGCWFPRSPQRTSQWEQASSVPHHTGLLQSPAATGAFPAPLGCLGFQIQSRHCNLYNYLEAG